MCLHSIASYAFYDDDGSERVTQLSSIVQFLHSAETVYTVGINHYRSEPRMKTRQRIFWALAILTMLFTCLWIYTGQQAINEDDPDLDDETEAIIDETAGGIAGTIQIFCGGVVFLFFVLLAWRNGVGLATERRHQEQLEAVRGQHAPPS